MTGKVKLTREQEKALKVYKATPDTETGKYLSDLEFFIEMRHTFTNEAECLKGFTIDEFARLLYQSDSYEVEEEYKVGDWAANPEGEIAEITEVFDREVLFKGGADWWKFSELRQATPEEIKAEKERRVWAKIGREIGEFRDGDAGRSENGLHFSSNAAQLKSWYEKGLLGGFHPVESFVSFGGGEE